MKPTTLMGRKRHCMVMGATFFTLVALPATVVAAEKWWEKGVSIFNSGQSGTGQQGTLSAPDVSQAFQEALRIGSGKVVSQLGRPDGFNNDPAVHIPLPQGLATAKSMLTRIGMAGLADDLELKLNRAAEAATPKAKVLFLQAISNMTFDDAMKLYQGPEDAATRYFQEKMSAGLAEAMHPIVEQSLAQVGAVQAYDNMIRQYRTIPLVPDIKANLTDHAVEKGMAGIFHYLAKEEAAIRRDPARQTTALLKRVFGGTR
ncbi:MAG: DUF4197 domain-containing protein [Desulfobulbaceae bacterium]|nr:DUF4197 domain-containing protein [Desulfobulbaceae bacterium]